MLGFTRTLQFFLTSLVITFGILLILLQSLKFGKNFDNRKLWVPEFLTVLAILTCIILLVFSYQGFIPEDSPGCLPHTAPIGVIAANVNPSLYYTHSPPVIYPASSYSEAVKAFQNSTDGFSTGYFSWDGTGVAILKSTAFELGNTGAPVGTSWVFEDLNTAVARPK